MLKGGINYKQDVTLLVSQHHLTSLLGWKGCTQSLTFIHTQFSEGVPSPKVATICTSGVGSVGPGKVAYLGVVNKIIMA